MKVELRCLTPGAEELIAEAYADCKGGRGKRTINVEDITRYIAKGHLSPLRHAHATFNVAGLSRVSLAQLVRHNFLALSVESQQSVEPAGFVCPQTIQPYRERWEEVLHVVKTFYYDMLAVGVPREDARYPLPIGAETFCKVTTNFEQWRWLAQIRAKNPHAQWEIREFCGRILDILKVECRYVFGDL